MNVIIGMTAWRWDALTPEQREYIPAGSLRLALGMINDILDFSKIERASWTSSAWTSTCATPDETIAPAPRAHQGRELAYT